MRYLLFSIFFLPFVTLAQTGFLDSSLWLLPEKPTAGELVTLTAVFRNQEQELLVGTIEFLNDDVVLGKKTLSVQPGNVGTATFAFTIDPGEYLFRARATSLSYLGSDGAKKPFTEALPEATMKRVVVGTTAEAKTESVAGGSVDQALASVLAYVPDSLEDTVTNTFDTVDAWRVEQKEKTEVKKEQSSGIGALLFGLLLFLLSSSIVFYLALIFLLFFILRFVYRRLARR